MCTHVFLYSEGTIVVHILCFTGKVTSLHHSLSETQAALRKAGSKECDGLAASATQAEVDSLQVILL